MDFVLALHSHLPFVLHHGRWPHGSDWLCEAALDAYLPLIETFEGLAADGVRAPVTLGITPILANQLAHPDFRSEMRDFFAHRIASAEAAPAALAQAGDQALIPVAAWWHRRLLDLQARFERADGDLVAALRELERKGRLELVSSAATHGFLPLLGRDESIRLQLFTGRAEHRRIFGRSPQGCWLPECAFRPAGRWAPPGARAAASRAGTDEHLRAAGYRFFFVDAHQAEAGASLGQYTDVPLGAERFGAERHDQGAPSDVPHVRSPYRAYRVPGVGRLAAFVRDPRSSMQVWSRQHGYPGDPAYLEFHKIRWPGGLKLWRVTDAGSDLGSKQAYDPAAAAARAHEHARHFAAVLQAVATSEKDGRVIAAPFDTELFGHWWSEGPAFIGALFRGLRDSGVRPATGSDHLAAHAARDIVSLAEGSWGAGGDFRMWLGDRTAWTWQRMWPLEDAFWDAARGALADGARRPILAQAARSLLLAQASDWPFIIATGVAADYAERRFIGHCDDAERLVAALRPDAEPSAIGRAQALAESLRSRDDVFPDVLDSVAETLG